VHGCRKKGASSEERLSADIMAAERKRRTDRALKKAAHLAEKAINCPNQKHQNTRQAINRKKREGKIKRTQRNDYQNRAIKKMEGEK